MNTKRTLEAKPARTGPITRRRSPATMFRQEIERAEAEGVARDEMILRLTLSDVSLLKRDDDVAVADISFADGVMRYLGVTVEQGGVTQSELVLPSAAS